MIIETFFYKKSFIKISKKYLTILKMDNKSSRFIAA